MNTHSVAVVLILFTALLLQACEGKEEDLHQSSSATAPDVVLIDTTNIPYTVELKREVVFESSEEVFIEGYISKLAVDDEDRIYLSASNMGTAGIYAFEPDGRFISKFGKMGRGPGEFESISSLSTYGDNIYVFDRVLHRFGIFSLDDFRLISDEVLKTDSIGTEDKLARILKANELQITDSGDIIAEMSNLALRPENEITKKIYHKVSNDGYIQPGRLLELDKYRFIFTKHQPVPVLMPFSRNSLVSVMNDGTFYTAWSEDFVINKHDKNGNLLRSYSLPYENAPLSTSGLNLHESRERILREMNIPETWPALYTIQTDDENRLWVSTITESDSTFQWWVLNEEGNVLARFDKPGNRSGITVMSKPIYKIKNGYFYERERDTRRGIDRIVKHKIEFTER